MSNMFLKLPLAFKPGKGKSMFELPDPSLLAMDFRNSVSTHNKVHQSEIPGKGEMIAAQTLFMALNALQGIDTHLVAWGRKIYDKGFLPEGEYAPDQHYHTMIVRRSEAPTAEFVRRDYLCGSLYSKYYSKGEDPYGLRLPDGLPFMYRFPQTVFTPTEKSDTDDPLLWEDVARSQPEATEVTARAYAQAKAFLLGKGIALIDAKTEAWINRLLDDWFNGDCARMARIEEVKEGEDPPYLDKERFRKLAEQKWGSGPKIPLVFSQEEIRMGMAGYHEGLELMTGLTLSEFRREYFD